MPGVNAYESSHVDGGVFPGTRKAQRLFLQIASQSNNGGMNIAL